MARRKPAWQQQREADIAKAREQYYSTRTRSVSTTVRPRKMDKAAYTSLTIRRAGTPAIFAVPISNAASNFFGGLAALGLQALASISDPVSPEPRGMFQPTRVEAMIGATAPTASLTPWGSRVIKYSGPTEGTAQASFTAPFSTGATAPTADALDTAAGTLYNTIKNKLGNQDYARFYWFPEVASFTKAG